MTTTSTSSRRICIVGGPQCGKTTRSYLLGLRAQDVRHTDDLIKTHEWSAQSEEVSRWFDEPGPWVIEGGAAVRALRKWLRANLTGTPCDEVHIMASPKVELTRDQESMLKGFFKIWRDVQDELVVRKVKLVLVQ